MNTISVQKFKGELFRIIADGVMAFMMLYNCSKFMKISLTIKSFGTNTIFLLNITNQNNSEKKMVELWFFSLHSV